jgi:catalase
MTTLQTTLDSSNATARDKGQPSLGLRIVDSLNAVFGKQTVGRAIHSKGIVAEGIFTPAAGAAALSKAAHLQRSPSSVTVRFSNFSGVQSTPDLDGNASPRGMAVKFYCPGGVTTDIVAHSFNGFPTATAEEFRQLFVALHDSGLDAKSPTALERFFDSHPAARAFFEAEKPAPVSYGTLPYFGINSFRFSNAQGVVRHGRYRLAPAAGAHYVQQQERSRLAGDYLRDELQRRLSDEVVTFDLEVQIADGGDKIADPSIVWPNERATITLGTIDINKVANDSAAAEQTLIFSPARVISGIEAADPMIQVRDEAYAVSYDRRHGCPLSR